MGKACGGKAGVGKQAGALKADVPLLACTPTWLSLCSPLPSAGPHLRLKLGNALLQRVDPAGQLGHLFLARQHDANVLHGQSEWQSGMGSGFGRRG